MISARTQGALCSLWVLPVQQNCTLNHICTLWRLHRKIRTPDQDLNLLVLTPALPFSWALGYFVFWFSVLSTDYQHHTKKEMQNSEVRLSRLIIRTKSLEGMQDYPS